MILSFFILQEIFFCLPIFAAEDDSRSAYLITRENKQLLGHVVKRFESRGLISCSQSCLRNPWCTSTNFNKTSKKNDKGICELNKHKIAPNIDDNMLTDQGGVTFSAFLKGCLMTGCLSGGSCLFDEKKETFTCSCKQPWSGDKCEHKMRSSGRVKTGTERSVWEAKRTACSCKDIQSSGESRGDGEYWIDPEKNGNALKVFCDMTTDGGGWLLISNLVMQNSTPPSQVPVNTSYRGIGSNQMLLEKTAITELRRYLSFTQMRFHCRKKQQGITFHVTTVANSTGEAVVQYFSGQTDVQPASCGSFVRMEDDNSRLAGVCKEWGWENDSYKIGKWGHGRDQDRLYYYPAFAKHVHHWYTWPSKFLCDDAKKDDRVGISAGDFWKVFVR